MVTQLSPSNVCISGTLVSCFPTLLMGSTRGSKVILGSYSDQSSGKERRKLLAVKQLIEGDEWEGMVREEDFSLLSAQWGEGDDDREERNLVRLICWGSVNGVYFLCMEPAAMNMIDLIDRMEVKSRDAMVQVLRDVTNGLKFLHGLRIVHGNIKPENVLIFGKLTTTSSGGEEGITAKLSDYSVRGFREVAAQNLLWNPTTSEDGGDDDTDSNMSSRSSPEGDIYSLGMLAYFAMTVQSRGESSSRPIKIISGFRERVEEIGAWEQSAKHLLSWMLHKDSSKRPSISQVSAHPFFWNVSRVLEFICDVGDMRWDPQIPHAEWRNVCRWVDQAFVAFYFADRELKFNWRGCQLANEFIARKYYKDPVQPQDISYEYDYGSFMSLVEHIRYSFKKHSVRRCYEANTIPGWYNPKSQLWNKFSVDKCAKFYLERHSYLPIILFCALTRFANAPWMDALSQEYSIPEYVGVEECSTDETVPVFMMLLKQCQNSVSDPEEVTQVAPHILDEIGSSDDEEEDSCCGDEWSSSPSLHEIERIQKGGQRRSLIESLVRKLSYCSEAPEVVSGTAISYCLDLQHRIGVETRTSISFRGHYGAHLRNDALVKLIARKNCSEILEQDLSRWSQFMANANVVNLLDWGREQRKGNYFIYYLCMETAVGSLCQEVDKLLADDDRNPFESRKILVEYLKQVADGLGYMHQEQHMGHGNITPTSILIFESAGGGTRHAKLGCFSESRLTKEMHEGGGEEKIWRSPEHVTGKYSTEETVPLLAADIFSLGLVIHYCLSGSRRHPFDIDWRGILDSMKDKRVTPGSLQIRTEVCAENLIQWMLQREPSRRPTSAQVISHPLFWTAHESLQFLKHVSDMSCQERSNNNDIDCRWSRGIHSNKIDLAYQKYHVYMHDPIREFNWTEQVSPLLFTHSSACARDSLEGNNHRRNKSYSPRSILSLVEFILDMKENVAECPSSHFLEKGGVLAEEKFLQYFLDRFPELLVTLYCALQQEFVFPTTTESSPPFPRRRSAPHECMSVCPSPMKQVDWSDAAMKTFIQLYRSN